jgi:hypothetical protein
LTLIINNKHSKQIEITMKFALAIVASVASAVKLHAEAQEDMTLILEDNGTWY